MKDLPSGFTAGGGEYRNSIGVEVGVEVGDIQETRPCLVVSRGKWANDMKSRAGRMIVIIENVLGVMEERLSLEEYLLVGNWRIV